MLAKWTASENFVYTSLKLLIRIFMDNKWDSFNITLSKNRIQVQQTVLEDIDHENSFLS